MRGPGPYRQRRAVGENQAVRGETVRVSVRVGAGEARAMTARARAARKLAARAEAVVISAARLAGPVLRGERRYRGRHRRVRAAPAS